MTVIAAVGRTSEDAVDHSLPSATHFDLPFWLAYAEYEQRAPLQASYSHASDVGPGAGSSDRELLQ